MNAAVLTSFVCRPGAVFIDGVFALDTSCDTSTYLPSRKFLLSFQPTDDSEGTALPFARMIDLAKGAVEPADGRAELYLFSDGRAAIILRPPCIGNVEILPYSLAQLGFSAAGRSLTATAYFDRKVNLAVEQAGKGAVLAVSIADSAPSVRLMVRSIASRTYLAAEIPNQSVHIADMMEMKLVLSESAVSFGFTGDAIVLQKNILGAAIEFKYSGSPSLSVSDCSVISAPTAQSALAALAVTSRYSPALSLLSPAFSGLSSADLSEFFGSFARVAPELSGEGVALCFSRGDGVFDVRMLYAETENVKISNISEK